MSPLRFELPLPANIGNGRGHWRHTHRAKKAYWAALDGLALVKHIPRPPAKPLTRAVAAYEWRLHNPSDRDNLYFRAKWINDWLTTRGYLVDDDPQALDFAAPTQVIARKDLGVTLTLTPIPEEAVA